LVIELVQHTKRTLNSIQNLTEFSRNKFQDKEFGELFYQSVTQGFRETNLLLELFLRYLSISAPIKKRDTIHRLIQEELAKYRVQLERKGIKLSKKFENDLPETIVPDEPLRYILRSILQYGVDSMTSYGEMGVLTQSFILQREEGADQLVLNGDGQYIEIKMVFTGHKKLSERFEETAGYYQEEPFNLILQLAKEVVRKNLGFMKFGMDEKKEKIFISVKFPSERREVVHYQETHPLVS
jgi:hypothetical protein